jgi:hypothetical protein
MRNAVAAWCGSAVCLVLLVAAAPASAQERSGFWFGGGVGFGSADVTCDDCGDEGDRENSGVAYLQAGWTFTEHLLIGAEVNAWAKKFDDPDIGGDVQVNIYNVLATATYYPTNAGFFVKGGAGMAFFDMDFDMSGISAKIDLGKGLGVIAGAGYDIPVGRVAITPAVNYWYGQTGDLTFMNEALLTGVKHNVITATIGIKFP